jgi:hypothetical protein
VIAEQTDSALSGKLTGREIFEQKSRWFAEKAGLNGESGDQGVDIDEDLFLDDEEGYDE